MRVKNRKMCRLSLTPVILALAINTLYVFADPEFEQQAQLFADDKKNFIVQAARDQNITLRMLGDGAALFINGNDILPQIKKYFNPKSQANIENGTELEKPSDILLQINHMKRDIQRLSRRLTFVTNRTRTTRHRRGLRRFAGRVNRVLQRLSNIEQHMATDDCTLQHQPCKNGGLCYDTYKDFYCVCPQGWNGKSCEEDVDECYMWTGTDLGCQNNAICINTPGSYRCNCTTGFFGTHCRLRNAICESPQSAELCGNGVCVPANNPLGYSCLCNQGWMKDNKTTACTVDVDECEESRNPCHDTCINLPGSFKCGPCPQGYSGNGRTCVDINECAQNNGGCSLLPRVQCINTEGSYHCGNCPPGWLGDGHYCEKAQSSSCDREGICHPRAKCVYISDTVVCTCQPGWYGHGFGSNGCSPGSDVSNNPCDKHECKNNATCVVAGRGTRCICSLGFAGPLCEINAACNPNPCRNGGTCNLLPENKYRCTCLRGTTGSNCEILRNTCGSILNQEAGELSYPPDDGNYEYNERCAWIIKTARTKVLNVTFSRFDLEESAQCSNDWLQIHDGNSLASQLIGRFCGKTLPLGGSFVSSHNQLFLWFRSDNATNGGGLKMSWISQDHTCGGDLELKLSDSGVIRSPGYPGKSPANRECEWRLNAPYGTRLIFRIYEVNLGGKDKNCSADTLKIFDSDQLLEAICSTQLPEPKHTSSNIARVHFHTDSYRSDSSFQLHYEVVAGDPNCGGVYIDATGTFGSNIGEGVCLYLIQLPIGTKIKLEFPQLKHMNTNLTQDCSHQKLEVFDGKTDDDPLLKSYCPGDSLERIISSSNNLLVRYEFVTAPKNPYIYQAKYSQACDDSFFGPIGGIFASPNYPNPYYDHISCTYNIYGPPETIIHVNFTDFEISETVPHISENAEDTKTAQDVDNFADYVDVYISHNLKRRYYKGEPMHLVSSKNQMTIVFHSHVNQRRSRGFRVEYSFETISCGGIFTKNEGSFSKYESNEALPAYCEWILEAPEGKSIKLDLNYGRRGAKCATGDVDLLIYLNGTISGDHLVASYCDVDRVVSTTYNHNLITIRLNRIPIEERGHINYGLIANYSFLNDHEDCGGAFDYKFGVIKSPAWPQRYPANANCTWTIIAPLGHKIEVVVHNFSLDTQQWEECLDYLEIRDGYTKGSPLIGKYCGESIPSRVPSFSNILRLHFHSDSHISDKGFYLTWQQTATGCGGKLNSHTGSIHSPFYPTISIGAVVCDWTITVAQGSRISLTITPTQGISNLCHDNVLSIYDGPNMLSRTLVFNCSIGQRTINLKTTSNQAFLRYSLADSGAQVGQQFMIDYRTDCVVEISDMQGVVESPNFPDKYPPSMNCAWDIRGRKNNHFAITFSHLYMERDNEGCKYDYFEVIDMRDEDVLKTHHMCRKPIEMIISEGNRLMLKFVTDYSISAPGFHVEYKQIGCGEHLHTDVGYIESPNAPYSVDVDCDWYIEVSVGKQIVLTFEELFMETEDRNCTEDILTVANVKDSDLYLLKECHISQVKTVVTSMANRMYIHFHTSTKRARKYFKATYTTKDADCGGNFYGKRGLITSPNYPSHYKSLSACTWSIEVDEQYGLEVTLEHFDLPESANCSDTFLLLDYTLTEYDDETIPKPYCGRYKSNRIHRIYKNKMQIEFQAGILPPQTGFALRFKRNCGGILNESDGYLQSSLDENCLWLITNDEGGFISLSILHLECSCDYFDNCTGSLNIQGSTTETLCTTHPAHIFSFRAYMFVTAQRVNFRGKISTLKNSCGGNLTSLEGELVSPHYPHPYPSNIECIWEIKTNKGNIIELSFDMLNITSSEHCNEDFLEVRRSENGPLLGTYCSNKLPTDTVSSFESVWIKFRSVEGSTGEGFKLRWNYAHISSLNGTEGEIESPPVNSLRHQAEPYYWRIMVPREYLIWLNFKEYNKGLNLFDGFDEVAVSIDIQFSPWQFTSSSNVILLKSLNVEIDFFKLEWKAIYKDAVWANTSKAKCNKVIVLATNANVSLTSPGYPIGYVFNLDCEWIIKLEDPTQHAILNITDTDIEQVQDCRSDYLVVASSSSLQDWHEELKLCNSAPTPKSPIQRPIHGTPNLKVNFVSDFSVSGRGFSLVLSTACGSNMTGPTGYIRFSHLQNASTFNSYCLWHIEVRTGRRIEFKYEIIRDAHCEKYALIYDGVDEGAPYLGPGEICNRSDYGVQTIMSTSNHAVVKYNTSVLDDPLFDWELTFREFSECDGEVVLTHNLKSVNISSPHYPNVPNPFTECSILVLAPPGESIQVEFVDRFHMNPLYCDQEYVEFFDGATSLAHSLGRYCQKPDTLRTSSNALYIHYIAMVAEPRNGYRINVSIALCGGTFSGDAGTISSSGYPAPGTYPAHTYCDYHIKMSLFTRTKITFLDIHLPYDAQNPNISDHLEIFLLYSETKNYYEKVPHLTDVLFGNSTYMPVLELDSNEVLIRLKTFNANHNYRGFKLKYERHHSLCIKDVQGESGMLTIARLMDSSSFHLCRWTITVPKGQRVRLEFFDLPQHCVPETADTIVTGEVRMATITIYNDHFTQSLIHQIDLNNFTGTPSEVVAKSSDNIMLVLIRFDRLWLPLLKNLRAIYSSDENSPCPLNIDDQDTGAISLEQLTSSGEMMAKSFYCKAEFTIENGETLAFYINELQVAMPTRIEYAAVFFRNEQFYLIYDELEKNLTNEIVAMTAQHGSVVFIQNDYVELHKFTGKYKRHRCGGQYELSEDLVLALPSIADPNYGSLDCRWVLKAENSNSGYKLLGNATLLGNCDDEYIKIYVGSTRRSLPLLTICRDSTPFNEIMLENSETTLIYHVREYKKHKSHFSFSLEKPLVCGETVRIYSLAGQLIVVDGKKYRNNVECSWDVYTVRGYYLSVSFPGRFFLENSINCSKDYLEIQRYEAGLWNSAERLCGRLEPESKNFTSPQLRFIFRTDAITTGDGFKILVKPTCDVSFNVTSKSQTIYTPLFRHLRISHTQCTYKLYAEPGLNRRINVRIIDGESPSHWDSNCELFSITAYKPSEYANRLSEAGTFCGAAEFGSGDFLQLQLKTKTERDFRIVFETHVCGGNITEPRLLSDPKDDDGTNYYHNMNCLWNVTAPADHSIALRFKYFVMEEHSKCRSDFLAIYLGTEVLDEKRILRLCGNMTDRLPPFLTVDSNQALIQVISDNSLAYKGFLLNVMFTQRGNERIELTEQNSQVTLVRNFTFKELEMIFWQYDILAPTGYRINLEIKQLNLGCNESDCERCNHMVIFDSVQEQSDNIGKFCMMPGATISLQSSFEDMSMKLIAEQPGNYSFEIQLQMEQTICGRNEFLIEENQPLILRFPLHNLTQYAPNTYCTWHILSRSPFQIEFEDFALQPVSPVTGKCVDFVQIRKQSVFHNFCGNFTGYKMFIAKLNHDTKAIAEIIFKSDELEEANGFQLIMRQQNECNRTYTTTSGFISTSRRTYGNVVCWNDIRVPSNYTLTIHEYSSNLYTNDHSCVKFYIKVIDLIKNETIKMICNLYATKFLLIDSNAIRIEYTTDELQLHYVATKKPLPLGCGGDVYTAEGIIENPPYGDNTTSDCRWDIVAPPANRIRIKFQYSNMGPRSTCDGNFVKLIEYDEDNNENSTQNFCETEKPAEFITRSNHVAVLAKKSPNFDGYGFLFRFATYESPVELA